MDGRVPRASAGTDLARLLLRGAIGGTLITHGLRHGRTLDGTADWFQAVGFRAPRLQAQLSAAVEVGGGAALVAGLATPLAAAAAVGTMSVAARSVHAPHGFFINVEGYEYVANLAVASAALAGLGPGRWSVDGLLGLDRKLTGGRAAAIAAGLGLAGAAAQLALFWRDPRKAQVRVDAWEDEDLAARSTAQSTR